MTEYEYVYINGAKIEKGYFEDSVAEANNYKWSLKPFPKENDHAHCIICGLAVPERDKDDNAYYKTTDRNFWLCHYCYEHFIN